MRQSHETFDVPATPDAAPRRHRMRRSAAIAVVLAGCATLSVGGALASTHPAPKAKKKAAAKRSAGAADAPATGPTIVASRNVQTPLGSMTIRTLANGKTCLVGPAMPAYDAPSGQTPGQGHAIACASAHDTALGAIAVAEYRNVGDPATIYGIAPDGVSSFTLRTSGQTFSIPVADGIWTAANVPQSTTLLADVAAGLRAAP